MKKVLNSGKSYHNPFSEHIFGYRSIARKKLFLSFTITAVVMLVEIVGGIYAHSIALISDAGHMFTHCFAIGISLIAIHIARKPPCHHRTYGLYRAEILAAFINGLFLLLVVVIIVYQAVVRIFYPEEILSIGMLIIGAIGLIVNISSILILRGAHVHDLNVKGVFYHMVADAASSVGIVVGAVVIYYTGWNILDPMISLVISFVIAYWAWGILRESARILLEMAPAGLNVDMLTNNIQREFPEIKLLRNVHLWTITADMFVFSAHIQFDESVKVCADHNELIARINDYLRSEYRIIESTLQIVSGPSENACEIPE